MIPKHNPNRAARVLVVEDEDGTRKLLQRLLASAGFLPHQVREARSAEEAVPLLQAEEFDLILSDYRMGGMTGVDLLAWARSHTPSSARVLITAYDDQAIAVQAINEGKVEAFVKKPWNNQQFLGTVQEILRVRRERSLREASFSAAVAIAAKAKPSSTADGLRRI